MKKLLLTAGLTVALSGTAMAGSGPGCGLGSMIFAEKPELLTMFWPASPTAFIQPGLRYVYRYPGLRF